MKKFAIALIVIAVIGGMIYLNLSKNTDTVPTLGTSARKAIPVKAVTIHTGDISSYITAPGVVKEVNKSQVFFDTTASHPECNGGKKRSCKKGQKADRTGYIFPYG